MKNKCKEKSSIVRKHEESVEESIGKKSKERLKNLFCNEISVIFSRNLGKGWLKRDN